MAEAALNGGFWLCDFAYAILEAIQERHFPHSIPKITLVVNHPQASSLKLQDILAEFEISTIPETFESLCVLIISSPNGVTHTIHNLHARGFAEVNDWSALLPAPVPGEVMSILSRQRRKL
jgi:16S rRNA C967 or C1407 C5-methylase (RsmB/RsmF family)